MGGQRRPDGGHGGSRRASGKARPGPAPFGGGTSVRGVALAAVLDWAEARWKPRLATPDPGARAGARTTLTLIATLRTSWAGQKVGDINRRRNGKGTVDLYVERRASQDVASGRRAADGTVKKVSEQTAWSEVTRLMAEVREYAAEHGMSDVPDVRVPTRQPRTVTWVERRLVARLLWAVRGRIWDEGTGDWKVDADGRRVLTRKRDIGWVARLILILVYSGSTVNCASRLAWSPSEDGTRSFFDLDAVIEGRRGHLLRLGPDLASKRMAGIPVAVCRRLASHLGRWRALDGGRHERVLHLTGRNGSRHASKGTINIGHATFERVCERAGLAGLVDLPTLSDTAAVWAIRAGSRPLRARLIREYERSPAIVRATSFMIGVDTRSFRGRFEHATLGYQEKAAKALHKPARSVR